MRILLVDDDELLVQRLVADLTAQNYVVDAATDGALGWEYAQAAEYDLIVLDVNLPKLDGITLCQRLRQQGYASAILLLTAKGGSADKISGLDAGADDYVVKPCPVEELTARMRALLRRPQVTTTPLLQWGALQLDPSTCEVTFEGQPLALSPKEYGLLELFLRNPQRIFSSSALLERLWGFEEVPGEETVRTHIKRLRRKLKQAGAEEVIENIYGMGYRLKAASAAAASRADEARAAAIAALDQFKDIIQGRLQILDQVVTALRLDALSEELRLQALQAAHKLAGSLGMFGLPEGSRLGRELEGCLEGAPNAIDQQRMAALVARLHQELQVVPAFTEETLVQASGQAFSPTSPPEVPSLPQAVPDLILPRPALSTTEQTLPLVLVVDDDPIVIQQLQSTATHHGLTLAGVSQAEEARAWLRHYQPAAVLLDLALPENPQTGLDLLEDLTRLYPQTPVLVFTAHSDWSFRLEASRRNCCTFLAKGLAPEQVLEQIRALLEARRTPEARVLAVDDDPVVLARLQKILPQWGIQLVPLDDSRQLWPILETMVPDLVILDLEMPHINGLELCQTLREDSFWSALPILFLSAQRDEATIQAIYRAGADDYIAKPFSEPELMTRIFNRLERSRLLRNLAGDDPVTHLSNQQKATIEINQYLALSRRYHQPFCLAVLGLQTEAALGATGHWQQDRMLKQVGKLLRKRFRREDVVARWGETEFLVGLYGVTKQQALQRIEQVLSRVQQDGDSSLKGIFRTGIACVPEDGLELLNLYQAAVERPLSVSPIDPSPARLGGPSPALNAEAGCPPSGKPPI